MARANAGFTLIEVLLALMIMAMIAMLSSQAFNTAASGSAATREAMDRMAEIDRAFILMETDFRNALPNELNPVSFGGRPLPAFFVSEGDDYRMVLLRGGLANPLFQARSETVRVGYRYLEDEIWRDTWYNPREREQEEAKPRKILSGVENLTIRVLSPATTSTVSAGPWLMDYPPNPAANTILPPAVEVTVELADYGEIRRLFVMLPGTLENFAPTTGGEQ